MAALAKHDPGYDVRRYFGTFHALPEDLSAQLYLSQATLLG